MSIRILYWLLLGAPVFSAQNSIRSFYGVCVNNAVETVLSHEKGIETGNARAFGFYLEAGLQKLLDSNYVLEVSIRYGRENSNFEVLEKSTGATRYYYFSNRTLCIQFSPGLVISPRQKLFLTTGLARFYRSNVHGEGTQITGRQFIYARNLNDDAFDLRLGLKWQIRAAAKKRLCFEAGIEASLLQYHGEIEIKNAYNTLPSEFYTVNYNMAVFHFGVRF